MAKRRRKWIFVLKRGLLPQQYGIYPFRPTLSDMPDTIMSAVLNAFKEAVNAANWMRENRISTRCEPARLASLTEERLSHALKTPVRVLQFEEWLTWMEKNQVELQPLTAVQELQVSLHYRHLQEGTWQGESESSLLQKAFFAVEELKQRSMSSDSSPPKRTSTCSSQRLLNGTSVSARGFPQTTS